MSSRRVELCDTLEVDSPEYPNLDVGGWSSILEPGDDDASFSGIGAGADGSGFFALK